MRCRKRRWELADSWAPCAVGMLPSPSDPCGRMPDLDMPAAERTEPQGAVPAVQHAPAPGEAVTGHEHAAGQELLDERLGVLEDEAWQEASVHAEPERHDFFARFAAVDAEEHDLMVQTPQAFSMAQIQGIAASVKLL